jgi:hypothetical protein
MSEESKNDHRQENGGANRSGGRQSMIEASDLGLCHEPQVVRHDGTLSKSIGAAKRARGYVIRTRMWGKVPAETCAPQRSDQKDDGLPRNVRGGS